MTAPTASNAYKERLTFIQQTNIERWYVEVPSTGNGFH